MRVLLAVLCACVIAGLGLAVATQRASSSARPVAAGRPPGKLAAHSPPSTRPPALAAAPATGAFGLDLLHRLGGGNLVLSPDSIAAALAMAGTGATGRTADQIASTLHLSGPSEFPAVGRLQTSIADAQAQVGAGNRQAPMLDIANGLFLQQGFVLRAPFISGLRTNFGASPQSVDFQNDSTGAVQSIDGWVSAHTQGIIPHVLSSLAPSTRLALANAVYLKASWQTPFKTSATAPAPFHAQGTTPSVQFMHETESLPYARGRGYEAVELPYADSTLSLLVVLPVGQSVERLQSRLNAAALAQTAGMLKPTAVSLSLPRFHIALQTSLNGPLQALGITDAFSEAADFSRMATGAQLKLGAVEHAADFTVDEQGTVAAAATVVTIEITAIREFAHSPVAFDANRPFLFFLRDDRSGAVLFTGRLVNPALPAR